MFGKKKVLKGDDANNYLQGRIDGENHRNLETRVSDISYQLHLLNKNIEKLIKKLD